MEFALLLSALALGLAPRYSYLDVVQNFHRIDEELLPAAAPEEPAPAPSPKCPSCGAEVAADAVICINCGTNLQTGERLQTEATENEDESEEDEVEPDEGIEKR